ncbi:hypothetical protein C8N46_106257 [Kordia periserrulae]|uniref:Leucine rich repeat (LRR) protein n=1 Tax=Kordia periserrulae TaxID=701523 RepID=A0A2T6BX03_9FLAO|nr:internalin [Kordia periserrulae]PTX60611.1 hypothetical protein C8N46_106257 [Kordia periserrulae]
MTINTEFSYNKPKITYDLANVDKNTKAISISDKTVGLSYLPEFNFEEVWLVNLNQKTFESIISEIAPTFLNLYACNCKDLSLLETLTDVETVVVNWNSKALDFWDFSKNFKLKRLHLEDFAKVNSLEKLSLATSLEALKISGGMNSNWKISTLKPISSLTKLKVLSLMAIQVADKSLEPLSTLTGLKTLEISNQFPTAEFARLSTKLKNTACEKFQPYTKVNIEDMDGRLSADVMITGSRKPFLNSQKDAEKINKYVDTFHKLVAKFERMS